MSETTPPATGVQNDVHDQVGQESLSQSSAAGTEIPVRNESKSEPPEMIQPIAAAPTAIKPHLLQRNLSLVLSGPKSAPNSPNTARAISSSGNTAMDLRRQAFRDRRATIKKRAEMKQMHLLESPRLYSPRRMQCVGNYDLGKTLGRGQFGKVKLGRHVLTNEKVAIKIIRKNKLDKDSRALVQREIKILKMLDHPNIIKLLEVLETERVLFLVMDYARGGEVLDFIVAHGKLSEFQAREFFAQIVEAVAYCHKKGIAHRDLKAENLLLDAERNIKLIDFGLSNTFSPGQLLDTFCGSPTYAAPELIEKRDYDGPAVDIWSLGVVFHVFLCGSLPFNGPDLLTLFKKILSCEYEPPKGVSDDGLDLLRRCLVVDPTKRATIEEIQAHPWFGPAPNRAMYQVKRPKQMDESVVDQLEMLGFDRAFAKSSVRDCTFNSAYATYNLLVEKKRQGQLIAQLRKEASRASLTKPSASLTSDSGGETSSEKGASPENSKEMETDSMNGLDEPQRKDPVRKPPEKRRLTHKRSRSEHINVLSTYTEEELGPSVDKDVAGGMSPDSKPIPPLKAVNAAEPSRSRSHGQRSSPVAASPAKGISIMELEEQLEKMEQMEAPVQPVLRKPRHAPRLKCHRRCQSVDVKLTLPVVQERLKSQPRSPLASPRRENEVSVSPRRIRKQSPRSPLSPRRGLPLKSSSPSTPEKPAPPRPLTAITGTVAATRTHSIATDRTPAVPRLDSIGPEETVFARSRATTRGSVPHDATEESDDIEPTHRVGLPHVHTEQSVKSGDDNAEGGFVVIDGTGSEPALHRGAKVEATPVIGRSSAFASIVASFKTLLKKEEKSIGPRTVRTAFHRDMTSQRPPEEILSELRRVLAGWGLPIIDNGPWVIESYFRARGVRFEMEVCLIPGLSNMFFIRMKRIAGDWLEYKRVADDLSKELQL